MTASGPPPATGARDDRGASLVEVLVASGLMMVVSALVTSGIVTMSRSLSQVEGMNQAQARSGLAFARLDGEVRYASDIAPPAVVSGVPTVTYYVPVSAGGNQCRQWRLAGDRLERRGWPAGRPASGGWQLIADGVAASGAEAGQVGPFRRHAPETANGHQRLELRVRSSGGGGVGAAARETAITFTAWNSVEGLAGAGACTIESR
ncbi:hypothetical protein GCM10010124_33460 [Pilimelia terevasa]|uniref:Uncharacterized protein n=1 Tax=Pilimelia terevasa TaxID=53372 RepID=A0A8J3FJK0_9ACTN|nr:hypothetical protein [Pilimelia terevasa]GGK37936.1 hypothetical protein GCM10010124_33460 [Pilimelia terevasa]